MSKSEALPTSGYPTVDKSHIVVKNDGLRKDLGFHSRNEMEAFLNQLPGLRDEPAHAQNIISGLWPQIVDLVQNMENVLQTAKDWHVETTTKSQVNQQ